MRHVPTPRGPARILAAAIGILVVLAAPVGVRAQLGPGDLQVAHALTANTAAWAVLRRAVRHLAGKAVIEGGPISPDTADTLTVLLALEDGEGRLEPVLAGAARGALTALRADDPEIDRLFAGQGLTLSRARAIACLVFGSAPEEMTALAEATELTEAEQDACPASYARFRDHWVPRAFALRRAVSPVEAKPVSVDLRVAGGVMASVRAILIAGQTIDAVGTFVSRALVAQEPMRIEGKSCGASEVTLDEAASRITLCYELVADLAGAIERGLVAGR
jgi:hypothetical protein